MPTPLPVTVRRESVVLPTYLPDQPECLPMFLEKRVYQGSSGRVYPLPVFSRIAEKAVPHTWQAIFLENEFIHVMLLPELGGRVHRLLDKTNGYDAIYYQPVIKPALVGLGGPWASGGIEFNWPQHHRPSTFMRTEVAVESHPDGSATVWMSEHDPMTRMKGMHGICLHPGRAVMELKVRLYNRTAETQTFLWWANAATRVHEHYQSFFPPDATMVADHAKRAMQTYPLASGHYYGIDYADRAQSGVPAKERPRLYPSGREIRPNDLSWYANIPVPTSYMCLGSEGDFFGGYDHRAAAGLLHVADHRIAPGKKQWTWGNHEFGYAWDRNLTDADEAGEYRPYIELMAGVYTENQPDFSFIAPGETRSWIQSWYPFRAIGPVHWANVECAFSLREAEDVIEIGVATTAKHRDARVTLLHAGKPVRRFRAHLGPDSPLLRSIRSSRLRSLNLTVTLTTAAGCELGRYTPCAVRRCPAVELARFSATEPPRPTDVANTDELSLIGTHLEQYRHATRRPEDYWREGLRRDSGDHRCHLALGRWHLHRGEFVAAERHLRSSTDRQTARNPNPPDGESYYQLGLCLRQLAFACEDAAERRALQKNAADAFGKAAWNHAWQSAAHYALAELAAERSDWNTVLDECEASLRVNVDHLRARNLKVMALRRLRRFDAAASLLAETRRLDPLDAWSAWLENDRFIGDTQIRFDLALDLAHAALHRDALAVLQPVSLETQTGTAPLLHYYRAWMHRRLGEPERAREERKQARRAPLDYCFPARLEEYSILNFALRTDDSDSRAAYLLGNWLYDRRRHHEAIGCWRRAARLEPGNAAAWRNLGVGVFNVKRQGRAAWRFFAAARRAAPDSSRLLFEQDQLAKRCGEKPARRLQRLVLRLDLVAQRDDLTLELCALHNQVGDPESARALLDRRRFQPWEGGEGEALGQHTRTHVLLGRQALARGDAVRARREFEVAQSAPAHLGEARHLLSNPSEIAFWLGEACAAQDDLVTARQHWQVAAEFRGDFQGMSVQRFSEMTHFSALALRRLGRVGAAKKLWQDLLAHARELYRAPAQIDYFATSLPTLLLFDDDLQARQHTKALFLEAQARLGLGQTVRGHRLLRKVLARDPSHAGAADLSRNFRRETRRPRPSTPAGQDKSEFH